MLNEHIWVELENYYGRLDFLIKLISEDELKPNEVDVESLWTKLKINLDNILREKRDLDLAIFVLYAISKILELKVSGILNLKNEDEDIIPFNFAFIFELQKIRKVLPQLEVLMDGGTKNYLRSSYILGRLLNVDVRSMENVTLQNIYTLYKNKVKETTLAPIKLKGSEYNWQGIIGEFMAILNIHKRITFAFLVKETNNTYKLLLYFVAILELAKEGVVDIYQEELYKDFVITVKAHDLPDEVVAVHGVSEDPTFTLKVNPPIDRQDLENGKH